MTMESNTTTTKRAMVRESDSVASLTILLYCCGEKRRAGGGNDIMPAMAMTRDREGTKRCELSSPAINLSIHTCQTTIS